jgi:nucleoside-diphosphate-sugar epimerase
MMGEHKIILEDLERIISANLPWENLAGKSVLITGANGFLPAYMVKSLLLLNDKKRFSTIKVIALVRNEANAMKRFGHLKERKDLKIVVQDVSKKLALRDNVDFVVHAASQASPKYYGIDPVGTLSANTIGTFNMLSFSVEKNVESFAYFSSSEVYGNVKNVEYLSEDVLGFVDPVNVRSCYAESKRMGETMCVSFAHQFGLSVKMIRPFHTYGPGLSLDDGRVFADFVANIINSQDIVMNSDGSAVRSFCYLGDAVIGFFTVLLKGEKGNAYNVANPNGECTIKDLATTLVELYPEKKLKAIFKVSENKDYLKSNFSRLTPDISKIKTLGWSPVISVREGFYRTIESFR